MKAYETKLAEAGSSNKSNEQAIAEITALSAETARQLNAAQSDKSALERKVATLQERIEELESEKHRLTNNLEHARCVKYIYIYIDVYIYT
jgi:hypothetical protein